MSLRVLIVPDKFKGTLTAGEASHAIARGWREARPADQLTLLPMSDGGDGFGEILAVLCGARPQTVRTVDAAHRRLTATWWWEPRSRTAIVESANVIGLAMLPRGKFHPFDLDTFGLGAVLRAAAKKGARRCLVGIGGSATNDGGFGLALALGWRFLDRERVEIKSWLALSRLQTIECPSEPRNSRRQEARFKTGIDQTLLTSATTMRIIVAVDVQNRLLGPRGCTRVFGPQKGVRPGEFAGAEAALSRLAAVVKRTFKQDPAAVPGAGAAGGLGFGLMAFAGAKPEPGFKLFARHANLRRLIRRAHVVLTGEGSLDVSTLMGKGVGEVADWCREFGKPCLAIGGQVSNREKLLRRFSGVWALADFATPAETMRQPRRWLARSATAAARTHHSP